jgi:hypothetical protein
MGVNPEITDKTLFKPKPKTTGNAVKSRTPFLSIGFLSAQISSKVQPNMSVLAIVRAKVRVGFGVYVENPFIDAQRFGMRS